MQKPNGVHSYTYVRRWSVEGIFHAPCGFKYATPTVSHLLLHLFQCVAPVSSWTRPGCCCHRDYHPSAPYTKDETIYKRKHQLASAHKPFYSSITVPLFVMQLLQQEWVG